MMDEKDFLAEPEGKNKSGDNGEKKAVPSGNGETAGHQENGGQATPAAAGGAAPDAETLAKTRAEKDQLYDRLLRKQAELENLKKRTQREKEEFRQHAAEDLLRALLPTLDSFERALKHRDPGAPPSIYAGMEMIYRELQGVLNRAGLEPLDTNGKMFDPHFHQAVETVEVEGRRDQEIVEELQRGYLLRKRLLRPAIVKVAVGGKLADSAKSSTGPNHPHDGKKAD